jgi:single-stranded DNA-specific DHH superfamily exonuclease
MVFVIFAEINAMLSVEKRLNMLEFLPIVAIATVCDVVPLVGINRAIVKTGLKILNAKNMESDIQKPIFSLLGKKVDINQTIFDESSGASNNYP